MVAGSEAVLVANDVVDNVEAGEVNEVEAGEVVEVEAGVVVELVVVVESGVVVGEVEVVEGEVSIGDEDVVIGVGKVSGGSVATSGQDGTRGGVTGSSAAPELMVRWKLKVIEMNNPVITTETKAKAEIFTLRDRAENRALQKAMLEGECPRLAEVRLPPSTSKLKEGRSILSPKNTG